jgi:hypothetical protein
MIPALTLALAMVAQSGATTMVTSVSGTAAFTLSWDINGVLWLDLSNTRTTAINGAAPSSAITATFAPIDLSLTEAEQATEPYRVGFSDSSGAAMVAFTYTDTVVFPASASVQFSCEGFAVLSDAMAPWSFHAFNYGAFVYINLTPASGNGADVASVEAGKLAGTSGTAQWSLSLSPFNPIVNPPRARTGLWYPAVKH